MTDQPKHEHPAMLYEAEGEAARCKLCGHRCLIGPDKLGICRVRRNVGGGASGAPGKLVSLNYDALVAVHVDPIEKKPLFHFLPASKSLSIAAAGCNFQCGFCQNWQISQAPRTGDAVGGQAISPEELVATAEKHRCASISYTYTEPTIFFELAYDTARLARAAGVRNVFVSNGYMTSEAVAAIAPYLDAINVDLKAFKDETYRKVMKASLAPVLNCLREMVARKVWVEVTTLIVPGMNDSEEELTSLAGWLVKELGPEVPWHVSRFHGDYQMGNVDPTSPLKLQKAVEIGKSAGLKYVYSGNLPGDKNESTACPNCKLTLIHRMGFSVMENRLVNGQCPSCLTPIAGVWG